jgi:RNA-binding protein
LETLTGRQRRFLRGQANRLEPSVFVGRDGLTAALTVTLDEAFSNQELVKVRLTRTCPQARERLAPRLAAAAHAHLVQVIGQTVVLYRPDPDQPRLQLPD